MLTLHELFVIRRLPLLGDDRDARERFGQAEVHGAVREEVAVGDGLVGVLALLVEVGLRCVNNTVLYQQRLAS